MQFTKWHGLGNDFVIVDGFKEKISDYKAAAVQICDRHFGIGADGLVLILPSACADFQMRIFNSDGSEAEMCGNATRCVARYVYENGLTDKRKITLETGAGLIKPELILNGKEIQAIRVDMGMPRLTRKEIPASGPEEEQIFKLPLKVLGNTYAITCVSMGNPHTITFVEDVKAVDLTAIGPLIETNPLFPQKTNVEFIEVIDRKNIRMRVWERGAGITLACGTGACASVVAAVLNEKIERQATVHLTGGSLLVEWNSTDNHVYITGPATEVFAGIYKNEK
ncbi:MAG: diaminopimelate epimerase [Pelosinus sp.]|nr:diaminopimelate epimerase [Pelosinus sp.]